jgi:hypothetical protein
VAPKLPGGSHVNDTELHTSLGLQQSSVFVHFCEVWAQHAPAHVLEQQSLACEQDCPFAMQPEEPVVDPVLVPVPVPPPPAG